MTVMFRCCANGVPMACRWCAKCVPVMYRWHANGLSMVCQWCAKCVPVMYRWHANGLSMVCQWCVGGMRKCAARIVTRVLPFYSRVANCVRLSARSRAALEKLIVPQTVENSPNFMQREGSLPSSQQPVICPSL